MKRSLIPKGATGAEFINKFVKATTERKIPIFTETRVTELIRDKDGRVTGVKAEIDGKIHQVNAKKGVVIATGGFSANVALRAKLNPFYGEGFKTTNLPCAQGDGIFMAEKVGAASVNMEQIQTYPMCDPISGAIELIDDARFEGAILINQEGKRFVAEDSRRDVIRDATLAQTAQTVYPLTDSVGFAADNKFQGETNKKALADGTLFEAQTIEELAGKIDVPADWANAVDADEAVSYEGKAELVEQVKNILDPVDKMDGDSLPVSAFMPHVDGQWELGAAAYEKRGVAVSVPTWDETKCIQCNNCAYVCPHATIRPFALTEEEAKNAPANAKIVDIKAGKGKGVYKYTMAISPLDCMGCGVCVGQCPVGALTMVGQESELPEQDVFNYCVSKVSDKKDMQDLTVKGSQFKQPMLEFSGSCAGCAETSYARLVTQLFGDRMYISNATGCSSIWGGPGATSPYCTDKNGHGPAWCNSLFEDNAEHGFGMYVGQEKIREDLMAKTEQLIAIEWAQPALKEAAQKWLDTKDDGNANAEAAKEYVAALQANIATVDELAAVPQFAEHAAELKAKGEKFCDCDACKLVAEILDKKDYLSKKSVWIFGGDGWAYDIGFGGVDHVLAQNKNVNVFVFDTEVYSNTGGQASKASNIGQVAQFAAAGKETKKKSLAEIAMSYGYIYVAQIAMGANPAQTIKAITEAEAYNGPSLIIGYSPCEMHSIKGGMINCQKEMKKAVECGYWNLFRFNPAADKKFTLDSKAPAGGYREFLMNEARYSRLTREFPERAEGLFTRNEDAAKERYEHLTKLIDLYDKQ